MKRTLAILTAAAGIAFALSACASPDYAAYVSAHKETQIERSTALGAIAASGSEAAKVAAIMGLTFGAQAQGVAPPRDAWDRALQALGILTPAVVQTYGIRQQTHLGVVQSNNALATRRDDNATLLGFGGLINAPVVVEQPAPVIVQQPAPVIVRPEVIQPTVIQAPAAP